MRSSLQIALILAGSYFLFNSPSGFPRLPSSHNCRFWGMVFEGELDSLWQETVRTHLDSLQGLSVLNNDGWGFGYYVSPDSNLLLPVTRRGEPMAISDPRYDRSREEMIAYTRGAAVAHIRNASSGPLYGLPNPHPFRRTNSDSSRHIDVLFAHNGTIKTECILDLIDPAYLTKNPPDYYPSYLDSDLYAIYLLQTIDTYLTYDIDSCIKMAVNTLVLHLHLNNEYALLNFILTDGSTLWALRYADVSTSYYILYYYYLQIGNLEKWIVASQPLDTTSTWRELANFSLLTLQPNKNPIICGFEPHEGQVEPPSAFYLETPTPNICTELVTIRFYSPDTRNVAIKLYDESGRLVAKIFNRKAAIGMNKVRYKPKSLPSGVYFIHLETRYDQLTEKVVIQR